MTTTMRRRCAFAAVVSLFIFQSLAAVPEAERLVHPDKSGRLIYEADAQGNRIPDFSHAGYGGGVPLPDASVKVVVTPSGTDDGGRIQAALDYVASLPLDERGLRGAVLLRRGRFQVGGSLRLSTSGVVLRGEGSGTNGTVVMATGRNRRTLIELRGKNDRQMISTVRQVATDYVPVNATELELDSADGLRSGDAVFVERPSTLEWIQSIGMHQFPGRPGPSAFSWVPGKFDVTWERRVTAVEGRRIRLDAPLTCALEKRFGGGRVTCAEWPGRIRQVGVENLHLESEWNRTNLQDEEHAWMGVTLDCVEDAWVRDVSSAHFASSLVSVSETSRRVTVQDCVSTAPVSELGGYRRHTFYTAGQQTLFLRCRAEEGRHDFVTGYFAAGPNVFLHCTTRGAHDFSGGLESWATGTLFDNLVMDGGGLSLDNREIWDQGVGWTAANSVAWQCSVPVLTSRSPAGAANWAIGCWAQFVGNGHWRSINEFVKPESLYRAQLEERLGTAAVEKVLSPKNEPAGKTSSSRPLTIEEVLRANPRFMAKPSLPERRELALTNGWLTIGGQLAVGQQIDLNWWRGRIAPNRGAEFGRSLTRFVPGRSGPGLTDDLPQLADEMAGTGKVGVRHHTGLWYDRRRDDHEMIRRITAEVWPPFYEQPWARSGTGRAWDGLSQYDLTKFNPWYFSRLNEFASLGAERGLVLVNAMYFQHNIIEAGAHWVDFPWRTANNINHTGFPEPPPFAGGKRIFMADEFYDVTQPVRRELHRLYIRQCLDNLRAQPNVLHVLGEEYSGPLSFMQFWLDVVAEWRAETRARVLIGLSAPKDVQDAILTDAKRAAQVDVIDFKYWWRTDKGLFAPSGGQSLAPRQHEREWKGGRPKDENLAAMAAEYRQRFPTKAVICAFDQAGWAFLAAGGSLANLPKTADARLLAAVSRMQPWQADAARKLWVLREAGKSCLVYSGNEAEVKLDLSAEKGKFAVQPVADNGTVGAAGEYAGAGRVVTLKKPSEGRTIFWLTKE